MRDVNWLLGVKGCKIALIRDSLSWQQAVKVPVNAHVVQSKEICDRGSRSKKATKHQPSASRGWSDSTLHTQDDKESGS